MRPWLRFLFVPLLAILSLAGLAGASERPPIAGFTENAPAIKNHPVRTADGVGVAQEGGEHAGAPMPVFSLPFLDSGYTCDNINDYDEACPYASLSPDVVYQYTPASDHYLTIDLCNSSYDTKVYVYQGGVTPGLPHACNDDFYPPSSPCGAWVSRIDAVPVQAGVPYFIVVDGWQGDCGSYQLRLDYGVPGPEMSISFEQLTFAFEGYEDVPYSSVGRANFSFDTPPTMGFLNMAAYVPGVSQYASWIVRNLLIPSSAMGPPTEHMASRFPMEEMGVLTGLPISQFVYGFTITEAPLNNAEVAAWYSQLPLQGPAPVVEERIEVHGYERGSSASFGWFPDPFEWFKPFQLPLNIQINSHIGCDMPNVQLDSTATPGDWNGCAPGACANSLTWLKDKHAEIDFPPDLRATFEQLSNLMNRLAKQGAGPEQILAAKLDFIEAYGLPIHVKYQSNVVEGNRGSTTGESSATDGDGAASAFPDTAWINAEAKKGEDVELGVGFYYIHNDTLYRDGGHAVVVTGTSKVNGVPRIQYKHDTEQADSTGTKQESSDVVVTSGGIIVLPGLGGKIRHTPSSPAVDVIPVVEAAFSESYDANVGAVPAQHSMNAYCDWVKRTIAPGQKITITYPTNATRCFNATVWRLDRTVQPPKWVKVTVWNFNSGQTREWVNPYPYPVTIAIHNDDHSAGGYTIALANSSVAPGEVTSPSNESAYGGFSLGGTDGSADEFGGVINPIVVADGSLGVELSDVPARLTSAPGGTHVLGLTHPIPVWNVYWENLGVEIHLAGVTSPGQLIIDCPSTGDHHVIDVAIDTELIALSLVSMPPATGFQISLQATAGLDFTFDSIGVPSLTPVATDVEDSRVPRMVTLEANQPNPFNPATTIHFSLPEASEVALDVFDVSGRLVAPLLRGRYEAGRHETVWRGVDAEGRAVASGIYFYQLRVGDQVLTEKMTLLR